jgi:hypothetical protein
MPMTNRTAYYNATFDAIWIKDFLGYMDEKGAAEHWSSLLFGGDPYFLTRMAFAALDVAIGTLEWSREDLRAFGAILSTKASRVRAGAELIDELNNELCNHSANSGEVFELPGKIRRYADFIGGLSKVARELSSKRLPTSKRLSVVFSARLYSKVDREASMEGNGDSIRSCRSGYLPVRF